MNERMLSREGKEVPYQMGDEFKSRRQYIKCQILGLRIISRELKVSL